MAADITVMVYALWGPAVRAARLDVTVLTVGATARACSCQPRASLAAETESAPLRARLNGELRD
jgi:hypothetical protein